MFSILSSICSSKSVINITFFNNYFDVDLFKEFTSSNFILAQYKTKKLKNNRTHN